MRKLMLCLSMLICMAAHAGTEDWTGHYSVVNHKNNQSVAAAHTKDYVQFSFIRAGGKFCFGKGSNFNGYVASESGCLKKESTPTEFELELAKFGSIASRDVTYGPTYPH